jgi:hypothetical protein
MKNAEFDATNDGKTASNSGSTSLNFIEVMTNNSGEKFSGLKSSSDEMVRNMLQPIDYSLPLDGSKSKALPEFIALTPQSNKGGVDGVLESVKDTLSGIFGERDTLHSHARMLARAGMSDSERKQLAAEEQKVKEYNQNSGEGLWKTGFAVPPKTPMLDELNRRTIALEQNISETAKKNMTPLQVAQLESGNASSALKAQYENQLISIVGQYERSGAVPAETYKNVMAAANKQRLEDESNEAKAAKIIDLLPKIKIDWGIEQPAIDPKKWMMMEATKTMH